MSRHHVRICESPGCAEQVPYGHPYPLDARFCGEHDPRQAALDQAIEALQDAGVSPIEVRQVMAGVDAALSRTKEAGDG